jgi:hypothetical protein
LSAEHTGAGAEQDREKLLPLINTDGTDQEKPKSLTTKDTKEHGGEQKLESKTLPQINADGADQEKSKLKPTTEARRHGEQPSWRDKSQLPIANC